MKIQINSNELRKLVQNNYEGIYHALTTRLKGETMIFADWAAGFGGVIQWTFPDDVKWRCLTQADTLDRQGVIAEFTRLKQLGEKELGTNRQLIDSVYSVPTEGYVYYALGADGRYRIMLAGWGYALPTQAPVKDLTYIPDPKARRVVVRIIRDNAPVADLGYEILRENGSPIRHTTNAEGEDCIGSLLPGESIGIKIPSAERLFTLVVEPDREIYTFDITPQQTEAPVPLPVNEPEPTPEEPVEEMVIDERSQDISIRFIDKNGKPLAGRDAMLVQEGSPTISEGLDENGTLYLDNGDFVKGRPIKVSLTGVPALPDATLLLEERENEYLIQYTESSSDSLLTSLLLILGALGLAFLVIWGAIKIHF